MSQDTASPQYNLTMPMIPCRRPECRGEGPFGLCPKHALAASSTDDPVLRKSKPQPPQRKSKTGTGCHVPGCDNLRRAKNLCSPHYTAARRHHVEPKQYIDLILAAKGTCSVCGKHPAPNAWVVDRDHSCCGGGVSCGKCVRGVICSTCNQGIGMLGDSLDGVLRAAAYLRSFTERPSSR